MAETKNEFYESLKGHQLQPVQGFALPVTLTWGDNPYITFPARGVLHVQEQGTLLGVTTAVFHQFNDDGSLGAPVVVRNPEFTYTP